MLLLLLLVPSVPELPELSVPLVPLVALAPLPLPLLLLGPLRNANGLVEFEDPTPLVLMLFTCL
jgi:hypothetical protein